MSKIYGISGDNEEVTQHWWAMSSLADLTTTYHIVLIGGNSNGSRDKVCEQSKVNEPQNESLEGDDHHGNGSHSSGDQGGSQGIDDTSIDTIGIIPQSLLVETSVVHAEDHSRSYIHAAYGGHEEGPDVDGSHGLLRVVLAHP